MIHFKLKKILSQETGLALVQVLVASAVLAGLITLSVTQKENASKEVSYRIQNSEILGLTEHIGAVLANVTDCTDIVNGTEGFATLSVGDVILPTTLTGSNLGLFLEKTDNALNTPLYGIQNNIKITDIVIERSSLSRAVININFELPDNLSGLKTLAKLIDLVVEGTNNSITSCHADPDQLVSSSIQRFCHGPGAIYDNTSGKCFLMGLNPQSCDSGEYVKGLSYDAQTMLLTPVCSTLPILTPYDTSGCYALALVPTGFDADGDIVCSSLKENYLWHLIDDTQKNSTSMDCSSKQAKISMTTGALSLDCAFFTPTPTPTETPTPTNTPAGDTPTPTPPGPTNTPTPTPTPTSSTPTATPTPCGVEAGFYSNVLNKAPQTISVVGSVGTCSGCTGGNTASGTNKFVAFTPYDTGLDTDTIVFNPPLDAQSFNYSDNSINVQYSGTYTGTPICDCSFYVDSDFFISIGFENYDSPPGRQYSDHNIANVTFEWFEHYTVTGCNMTGQCTATKELPSFGAGFSAYASVFGSDPIVQSINLSRIDGGDGLQYPDIEGTSTTVCTLNGNRSRWTMFMEARTSICGFSSGYHGPSCQTNIYNQQYGSGRPAADASCNCTGGTLNTKKGFILKSPSSSLQKTIGATISSWTE